MKKQILVGALSLAGALAALGQPATAFVNNTILTAPGTQPYPPNIDALNFTNNSIFEVDLLAFLTGTPLFQTKDTVNYANYGTLASSTGFRFDTSVTLDPPVNGQSSYYTNAGTLLNDVGASLICGGTNNISATNLAVVLGIYGLGAQCLANATNVINHGTIEMGINSLLSLKGNNIDLKGGLLNMEGFESGGAFNLGGFLVTAGAGVFDSFWGFGVNNDWVPSGDLGTSFASFSRNTWVTNRYYNYFNQGGLTLNSANVYQGVQQLGTSNYIWETVYIHNLDPAFTNNVFFFQGGAALVEWRWSWTNFVTGAVVQDALHFLDDHVETTNMFLVTNGLGPASIGYRGTYITTNFSGFIHDGSPFAGVSAPSGFAFSLSPGRATNDYTMYQAYFRPTTAMSNPFEVAGMSYSNMPGRIEISAANQLNLTNSRISGLNYVKLNAPNNFSVDPRTRILTYAADYNLAVTNGSLTVTNLLPPTCPRLNGFATVASIRWTNVDNVFGTNVYLVLMVDNEAMHNTPTILQNLNIHSANASISDVLNVVSNMTIDSLNLTITTNGQLNLLAPSILWTNALPRLATLTNYGVISINNSAFFGEAHYPPFYPTGSVSPYAEFVNYSNILTGGAFVWATDFQDYGLIDGGLGSVSVQATTATLTNATLNAVNNSDISLNSSSLFASHTALNASRRLTLSATASLDDGGVTSSNFWTAGAGGFNLLGQPSIYSSLLGTTISNTAPSFGTVVCEWAGRDLGAVSAGYSNNSALGRLVLNGLGAGSFELQGISSGNALYVDYLELRDNAAKLDDAGNLANVTIDPGIKLYFAQLIIVTNDATGEGYSRAERLNGKNGGGLNWVSSYAGAFSSTNITYPDGKTYSFNKALRDSCDLDSNNDGIPNCSQLYPFFVPSAMNLVATHVASPPAGTLVSWQTVGSSANYVYYKTNWSSPNWLLLTNFVFGPNNGQASVLDTSKSSTRFYRVRVDLPH